MVRAVVVILVLLYAFVPPGFCLCRLEAALMDHEHAEHEQEPGEPHDDDDCGCGQLKPDGITCSSAMLTGEDTPLTASLDEPAPFAHADSFAVAQQALGSASDRPLYLTLRAFLL